VTPWFFLTGLMNFEPKLVSVFGRDWRTVLSSRGVYVLWVCSPRGEVIGDGPNVGQIETGGEHRSNNESWVLSNAHVSL
jgi:hypothetical protein